MPLTLAFAFNLIVYVTLWRRVKAMEAQMKAQ